MRLKALGSREENGAEDHRQHHRRENDVAEEDEEVNASDQALALKTSIAVETVVHNVAHEKNRRKREGGEHHPDV